MFRPSDLFDLTQSEHAPLFEGCAYAWDALHKLKGYLKLTLRSGGRRDFDSSVYIGENVFIGQGTVIEPGVMIKGPAIIGKDCELRHGAYIREDVIIGDKCVVGNSCEIKHSLLFNDAKVPHFSYVGDSIFGYGAHLGAGVKISNIKLISGNVFVQANGKSFDTGLRKLGAILGDHAEVGCNSVLNPGSIIGRNSIIYPNSNWRGVLAENMIAKNKAPIEVVERRT